MSGTITLHPELGINARLTICPRCGCDTNELAMLGIRNHKRICSNANCKMVNYGANANDRCAGCGENLRNAERIELTKGEKVPSSMCTKCDEELKAMNKAVEEGGIFVQCKVCGMTAVAIASSNLAKDVRKYSGIAAPNPVGYEFESCDQHTVSAENNS